MSDQLKAAYDKINEVSAASILEIERSRDTLLSCLDEWKNGPNDYYSDYIDNVILFIGKYLDWETRSQVTRYWKERMFKEVMRPDTDIIGPLLHFISHEVWDDGSFSVGWYEDSWEMEEIEISGIKMEMPTSTYLGLREVEPASSGKAFPVVKYDFNGGTQDPKEIIEAMVLHEENQKRADEKRNREIEEKMRLLAKIRAMGTQA